MAPVAAQPDWSPAADNTSTRPTLGRRQQLREDLQTAAAGAASRSAASMSIPIARPLAATRSRPRRARAPAGAPIEG